MPSYLVQPRDQIFVKGYGFLSYAKSMGKNMGKNISKNVIGRYSKKIFDHAKQPATDAFKTASKRAIQKTAEATGNLIGSKITKVSKNLQQNNQETVTNEHDKEIPKKRYISSEERQEVIDKLRLKYN